MFFLYKRFDLRYNIINCDHLSEDIHLASAANKKTTKSSAAKSGTAKKNTSSGTRSTAAKTRSSTAAKKKTTGKKGTSAKNRKKSGGSAVSRDLLLVLTITVALLLFLSLFGLIGSFGEKLAAFEFGYFGVLAYIFPLYLLVMVLFALSNFPKYPANTLLRILISFVTLTLLSGITMVFGGRSAKLGAFWYDLLFPAVGKVGTAVILIALLLAGIVLTFGKAILVPLGLKSREVAENIRDESKRFREENENRRIQAELRHEERMLKKAEEREAILKKAEEARKLKQAQTAEAEEKRRAEEKADNAQKLEELRLRRESMEKREAERKTAEAFKAEADRQASLSAWDKLAMTDEEKEAAAAALAAGTPLDELIKEMESSREAARPSVQKKETRTLKELNDLDKPVRPKKELYTDDILQSGNLGRITGREEQKLSAAEKSAAKPDAAGTAGRKNDSLHISGLNSENPFAASERDWKDPRKSEQPVSPILQPTSTIKPAARPAVNAPVIAAAETQPVRPEAKKPEAPFTATAEKPEVSVPETASAGAASAKTPELSSSPFEKETVKTEAFTPELKKEEPTAVVYDAVETEDAWIEPADAGRAGEIPLIRTDNKKKDSGSIWSDKEHSASAGMNFSAGSSAARPAASVGNVPTLETLPQAPEKKEYVLPPADLLKRGKIGNTMKESELRRTAAMLEQTLADFGVVVSVTDISCGPSVTRYELKPEQGVKVSRIVSLADDIKLSLAATDIRIEAPIPGKSAVGIEVPNTENQTVYMRSLVESDEFKRHPSKLSFTVGQDIGGKFVISDLAKMPHLLIAGATGSGKSVCINAIIMSILYKAKPEEVQMLMIDPKVVELSVYNGIPHLRLPVVTDAKLAAEALNAAVKEMTNRYKKFADMNVRDIKSYNAKIRENPEEYGDMELMPQLVIIVDEFADLMMVSASDVEQSICRLAQLARAAGMHLVLATQRPSVNVITGLIKANVQSRIAFAVSSGVDSRTIIDMNGAEKLLGKGDMLFYPTGYPKPVRVQGVFVSDDEVAAVTEFWRKQNTVSQKEQAEQTRNWMNDTLGQGEREVEGKDELFVKAAEYIIDNDKASIGNLQRVFRIGFNRAARLMDQLADAGIVSKEDGTRARQILMDRGQFEDWKQENGVL